MRILLSAILLFLPVIGMPQVIYKMPMTVAQGVFGRIICNSQEVIWGYYADTVFFAYSNQYLVFKPYDNNELRSKPEKVQRTVEYLLRQDINENEMVMVRTDNSGEFYLVRILFGNGVIVFINNLEYKDPFYSFCFGGNCFCPP